MVEKPNRREVLLGTGAALGALSGCMGSAQENGNGDENETDRSIEWGGQGSENAELDCDEYGYWHWVLTPGGNESIDADSAELTVEFADGSTVTVEGYRPGQGQGGAVHFDVYKEGGGEIDSATVSFSGGGENVVLTISEGECVSEDEVPEDAPLPENGEEEDDDEDDEEDDGEEDDDEEDDEEDDDDEDEEDDGEEDDDDEDDEEDDGEGKKKKPPAVDLHGLCYKDEKGKGQFRIENHEKEAVTVTWKVLGTARSGTVSVPKKGSETVWVNLEPDQKLALYDGDIRVAAAKVSATSC